MAVVRRLLVVFVFAGSTNTDDYWVGGCETQVRQQIRMVVFVVDGSSTVALPAAAVRGVEVVRIALIEQRCEREY